MATAQVTSSGSLNPFIRYCSTNSSKQYKMSWTWNWSWKEEIHADNSITISWVYLTVKRVSTDNGYTAYCNSENGKCLAGGCCVIAQLKVRKGNAYEVKASWNTAYKQGSATYGPYDLGLPAFTLKPGASATYQVAKLDQCSSSTVSLVFKNPLSAATSTKPTLSVNCSALSGSQIKVNASVNYGKCVTTTQKNQLYGYVFKTANDTGQVWGSTTAGTSNTISGLQPNTRYYARFIAGNGCINSDYARCNTVTLTPSTPSASNVGTTSVYLCATVSNGGGVYTPSTQIQYKPVSGGSWTTAKTTSTTSRDCVTVTGLNPSTCYYVRTVTTTTAGTYTSSNVQFCTQGTVTPPTPAEPDPPTEITASYTKIDPQLDEDNTGALANICYDYKSNKVPATYTVYYRKYGNSTWILGDTFTTNEMSGNRCFTINNLEPNQVIYETYIHGITDGVEYDSPISQFTTPLVPEPNNCLCDNFKYLTDLLCQAVVALYEGNKKIYANPATKEQCDPLSPAPTTLTLWSRALRLMHAQYCIACDMSRAMINGSHDGQYFVGEIGWVDIKKEIDDNEEEDWKLVVSDAVAKYLAEKLKQVWHYQSTVDVLVDKVSNLNNYPNATTAIVASEDKVYKKTGNTWTVDTTITPEDFGVFHINDESSTDFGLVQAGSAWYYWQGTWNNLDLNVTEFAKRVQALYDEHERLVLNEAGKDELMIQIADKDFDCSTLPEGKRVVAFITENVTQPDPVYHVMTFNTGEGSTQIQSQNVLHGALAIQPPDPVKQGWNFGGWELNGEPYDFTMPVTGNITLDAIWVQTVLTVTFSPGNANGTVPEPMTVNYGSAITLPEPEGLYLDGATFDGWYYDNVKWTNDMPVTNNITLSAKFKYPQVTVAFNPDNGDEMIIVSVEYGQTVTPPNNPAKDEYEFLGWYNSDGTPADFSQPITENTTFIAKYATAYFTITFNTSGGSEIQPVKVPIGDVTVKPQDPTKEGEVFNGWLDEDGNLFEWGRPLTKDITLTAMWGEPLVVTFDTNGGEPTNIASQNVPKGGTVSKPQDPTKEGCEFAGWTSTIYRKVTLHPNNGDENTVVEVEDGKTIEAPANPTLEDCRFEGWTTTPTEPPEKDDAAQDNEESENE